MIIKLVRDNTAYFIRESVMPELYSQPVGKQRLTQLSEIVIDLNTQKVMKSAVSVESVFDGYVSNLNQLERAIPTAE